MNATNSKDASHSSDASNRRDNNTGGNTWKTGDVNHSRIPATAGTPTTKRSQQRLKSPGIEEK
jgi:hypothetical protein